MKLSILNSLLAVSLILILSGCVGAKPKPQDEAVVDSTLPKIVLTENGTITSMKSIALEWKAITDKRVVGIYVYKKVDDSNENNKNDFLQAIENRFSTHFLDKDVNPNSQYIYYFKTYSNNAESIKSNEYRVISKPIFKSVSWIYAKSDMPRSAKIIWRPHKNKSVESYLIQRKTLSGEKFENIAKLDGRLNAEYIDFELKDKFTYIYQIRAITYQNITSLPSDTVTVTTKALPIEVTDITATSDVAKKIKLKWKKDISNDFLHYNIYRSKDAESGYELIAQINENSFVDEIQKDGEKYFYRISVVDKDALESNHDVNFVFGMSLVKPSSPAMLEAKLVDNKIILKWDKTDKRTKSYIVIKKYKKSMFESVEEQFDGIVDTTFIDSNIISNTTYSYHVFSVDENGIFSEPSIEVKFETKKIDDKKEDKKIEFENEAEPQEDQVELEEI